MTAEWTPELTYEAADMVNKGIPYSVVAKTLFPNGEKSRNAVIGRLRRFRDKGKVTLRSKKLVSESMALERRIQSRRADPHRKVHKRIMGQNKLLPLDGDLTKAPKSLSVSLVDIEPIHCRAITHYVNREARFCGHDKNGKSSYCSAHYSAYILREKNS